MKEATPSDICRKTSWLLMHSGKVRMSQAYLFAKQSPAKIISMHRKELRFRALVQVRHRCWRHSLHGFEEGLAFVGKGHDYLQLGPSRLLD